MDTLSPGRAVIYVLAFMPMGVFVSIGLFRGRWREAHPAMTYALLIATICAIAITFGTVRTSPRYFLFVLPFYALLLSGSVFALSKAHSVSVRKWLQERTWRFKAAGTLVTILMLTLLALGYPAIQERYGHTITRFASPVVGTSCGGGGIHCDRRIKVQHSVLEHRLEPDDLIISSEPFVTYPYLGRVDGYLRNKVIVEEWNEKPSSYDYLEDEYLGVPLIDGRDLEVLLHGENRVWVIRGPKAQWISSEETLELLGLQFRLMYKDDLVATYVNCLSPPCASSKVR